jgi:hypothetical protein
LLVSMERPRVLAIDPPLLGEWKVEEDGRITQIA